MTAQDNQLQQPPALPVQQLVRLNLANNLITSLAPAEDSSSSSSSRGSAKGSSSASGSRSTAQADISSSSSSGAGCWPVLQSLDVSGNRLVEPGGLPACPQLLSLQLSRNQLTGLQVRELSSTCGPVDVSLCVTEKDVSAGDLSLVLWVTIY
jgi:Leucine-rich repeat (LRR) protein